MRILTATLLAGALTVGPVQAAGERYEQARLGLSVSVPAGWTVETRALTPCTDPVQRIALRGKGALVQIQERLVVESVARYPARPARFELRGAPNWIACCVPEERKDRGWLLTFRDGGRAFYAYVFLGSTGTRRDALAILDSLDVRPRSR